MSLHKPRTIKQPLQLDKLPIRQIFSGIFRMSNTKSSEEKNGVSYTNIELHDATGFQIGLCETSIINWLPNKQYQLVNMRGYFEQNATKNLVHIIEISPTNGFVNIGGILSLPRKLCINPIWLERLINLRRNIESPALGRFVDLLFADDEIAFAFLQVPASTKYHHNYIGGLLEHSVEVAEITSQQDYENNEMRDIAVVAALLHDIGKVRTLGINLETTALGKVVGHDSLTFEICALALRDLDKSWSSASYTLRHVWSCATPGAKYGFEPNCTIANIIRYADKISVDRYYEKQTFKDNNKTDGLAWDGKKYYWRPSPETKSKDRSDLCLLTNTH